MRVMVIGATSWIGSKLIDKLINSKRLPFQVLASYNSRKIVGSGIRNFKYAHGETDALESNLAGFNPEVIVNLSRGEDQMAFTGHELLSQWAQKNKSHYIYSSSAAVFNSAGEAPFHEDRQPVSRNDYGRFKIKCEESLSKNSLSSILRFCCVQGYDPYSVSRTEKILIELQQGKAIPTDSAFIQNRIFDEDLAQAILNIIEHRATGIFHLGSQDPINELIFRKNLATAFGYSEDLITDSPSAPSDVSLYSDGHNGLLPIFSEADLIRRLRSVVEFQKYVKG